MSFLALQGILRLMRNHLHLRCKSSPCLVFVAIVAVAIVAVVFVAVVAVVAAVCRFWLPFWQDRCLCCTCHHIFRGCCRSCHGPQVAWKSVAAVSECIVVGVGGVVVAVVVVAVVFIII